MIATSTLLINNIQTMEVYEMLVLNEQDQQNLLDMKEVIEEVGHALQAFSEEKRKRHYVMYYLLIKKIDI